MQQVEKKVAKKEYMVMGRISNDEDVMDSFEYNLVETGGYICDLISQTADESVPIYDSELWENANALRIYIEEAIEEFSPFDYGKFSLTQAFGWGHYRYFEEIMYDNLETALFNVISARVNELLTTQINQVSIEKIRQLEVAITTTAEDFSNNDQFSCDILDEVAANIIEAIF